MSQLQLVIATTTPQALQICKQLGHPRANWFESWLMDRCVPLLPVPCSDSRRLARRHEAIIEVLVKAESEVVFMDDYVEGEDLHAQLSDLFQRHNLPEKMLFLPKELWVVQNDRAIPLRCRDGSSQPIVCEAKETRERITVVPCL